MNIPMMDMDMDIDPPEVSSYTHEPGGGAGSNTYLTYENNNTPRSIATALAPALAAAGPPNLPTSPRTSSGPAQPRLFAPTPQRRVGGGLAVQALAYGTPSPTPSPSPSSAAGQDWRESAGALQADIAAQFEAEDRRAAGAGAGKGKRKRKRDRSSGDDDEEEGEGEEKGEQGEVDRLLDDLVWWLAETRKRRRQGEEEDRTKEVWRRA